MAFIRLLVSRPYRASAIFERHGIGSSRRQARRGRCMGHGDVDDRVASSVDVELPSSCA